MSSTTNNSTTSSVSLREQQEQVKDLLRQNPDAAKRMILNQCENNLARFARFFLPQYVPTDPPDFHLDLYHDLLFSGDRVARAEPREHAKSTIVSMVFVLHQILFKKRRFIVLVSDTSMQAENFAAAVKYELEANELIREYFGDITNPDGRWRGADFITTTGVRLIAKGAGASLRGIKHLDTRPDLVVCDDLENDENVNTPMQREKLKSWFDKVLTNAVAKHGKIVVVGTILHYDSLLSYILTKQDWNTAKYAALVSGTIDDDDAVPLWPDYWDIERLRKRKVEIGSLAFQSEFMNEPVDGDTAIVRYDWLQWYNADELPPELDRYGFCDPAISQKETADYFVICVLGHDKKTGRIYVLDIIRDRIAFSSQVERIGQQDKKHDFVRFGVEDVAYQKALYQEVQRQCPNVPVVPVTVDKDKTRRLQRVSPFIENGTIQFRREHVTFIEELVRFPKAEHDDTVDGFTGAVGLILDQSKPTLTFF